MTEIRHYLNGFQFGLPRNWQNLEITVDWTNENQDGTTINANTLEFVGKAKDYINEHIANGLNGGIGIFEGIPYKIEIGTISAPIFVFDGYLDLTTDLTVFGKEEITAVLKKRNGREWLTETAESFSFAYLYDQGTLTDADFIKVPYVINYVPDNTQLALINLSIFLVTKELIENTRKVLESIADATNAATPGTGVGLGANAGGPIVTANVNQDLGDILLLALKILAQIAYVIAMTVGIINLIENLFEQLLPKQREHLGMSFKRMLEVGCLHLGLTLETDIAELEWVHIPRKGKKGGDPGERGFPINGGNIYTFGDAVTTILNLFNANYQLSNSRLIIKRRDKFVIPGTYQIPAFLNEQDRLLDLNGYNTDEMLSNYNITWSTDVQDQNTLENLDGMYFQAITSPINSINTDLVNIKGLGAVNLPFSLGRRKDSLTDVEKLAKSLGNIVDQLTGIFGGGTNFKSKIESRIGALLLSSHFLTTGKVVKMNGSKLANAQRENLSAKYLWENFHFINSFAPLNGVHNQYYLFKDVPVTMDKEQFEKLLENNTGINQAAEEFEIETVKYLPHQGKGLISYRIKKLYTNNLKIEIVE